MTLAAEADAVRRRVRHFSEEANAIQSIPGWNLNCVQISTGALKGHAIDLFMPSIQVLYEDFRDVTISHFGSAPAESFGFGIARQVKGDGLLSGAPWRDGFSAFDTRHELEAIVPPAHLTTVVVERRVLREFVWHTEHLDIDHWLKDGPAIINDAPLAARMGGRLDEILCAPVVGTQLSAAPAMIGSLRNGVLELLGPLIAEHAREGAAYTSELAHLTVVRRAREYLAANRDDPPRIVDLCKELKISRRWLQMSFNAVLGTGPLAYLRLLRLDGARRMFLSGRPGMKVKDAVEAFGFWHPSRFSRDYRSVYGELPLETLKRIQGSN